MTNAKSEARMPKSLVRIRQFGLRHSIRPVFGSSRGTMSKRSSWAAARMSSSRPRAIRFCPPRLLRNSAASRSGSSGSAPRACGRAKAWSQVSRAVMAWPFCW